MEPVQPSTLPAETHSTEHITRRHSSTGIVRSFPSPPIGSALHSSTQWSNDRTLPPILQTTNSPPRIEAGSSRVYLPPLDTHQYHEVQSEWDAPGHARTHPNKRRRLSGNGQPQSHTIRLGFADSPGPRGQWDQAGNQPNPFTIGLLRAATNRSPEPAGAHSAALAPPVMRREWTQLAPLDPPEKDGPCCSNECQGPKCSVLRRLLKELLIETAARIVSDGSAPELESHDITEVPDTAETGLAETLEWALYRLRWRNSELRHYLARCTPPVAQVQDNAERLSPRSPQLQEMKRPSEPAQSDPASHRVNPRRASDQPSRLFPAAGGTDERWPNVGSSDSSAGHPVHHRAASTSGAMQLSRTESPSGSQYAALMLPSPTSLNLPVPAGLPSISPPSSYSQSAAHAAHLQDLQHQVSVKTLALQTLQREYDSLLQKLERMRTKCATLEKKFEVTDAEIHSLTDERERLEKHVEMLENQLEEAQIARDEARSTSAEQASQYMKIMEMSGRLQAQAAEDRKKWETEKENLLKRFAELQTTSADASGAESSFPLHLTTSGSPNDAGGLEQVSSDVDIETSHLDTTSDPTKPQNTSDLKSAYLRSQLRKLEARVHALEGALRVAREESRHVREAAVTLASASQRIETAADKVTTGPESPSR